MSETLGELWIKLGIKSTVDKDFSGATDAITSHAKKIESLGSSLTSVGKGLTAGVTAPIVGAGLAFAGVAKEGMDFEQGMASVYTLLTSASEESFQQMSKDTLQFAKDMKVPVNDVLPALYDAIGAGVPEDNVFSFLEVAQKGAVAGATNVGVAVDTLTSLMNAYGAENLSAADASDILFAGINVGKMSYEELRQSLSQVIPTAASLGIPLEQVTGALAAMTAQGTPTATATTQLARLFEELAKEGTQASDTFKQISGKSFPQFIKDGGDVQGALKLMQQGFLENSPAAKKLQQQMEDLADPTSGIAQEFEALTGKSFKDFRKEGGDVAEALKILGIDTSEADGRLSDMFGSIQAGNAVLTLTSRDGAVLNDVMDEMGRSAGQTDDAYAKMSATTKYAFEGMQADIKNAVTELGVRLLPTIRDTIVPLITDTLIPAFEKAVIFIGDLAEAFNKLPGPIKTGIVVIVALAAAIGPLLVVMGSVVSAVGTVAAAFGAKGMFTVAFTAAKASVLKFIPVIAGISAPILVIIGVIALLALAWKNNWFDIQGKTKVAVDFIIEKAKLLWVRLGDAWDAIIKASGDLKTRLGDTFTAVQDSMSRLKDRVGEILTTWYNKLSSIYESIKSAAAGLLSYWMAHWNSVEGTTNTASASIGGSISNLLSNIRNLFGFIVSAAQSLVNNLRGHWDTALANLNTFKTNVINGWNEIKTSILQKLNAILEDIQTFVTNQTAKLNDILAKLSAFKTNVVNRWNEIKASVQQALDNMVNAIKNGATDIGNAINNIVTKITGYGDKIKKAGAEIVQKLIDGINDKIASLKKKVTELTDMVGSFFPMNSPSITGALSKLPKWDSVISNPLSSALSSAASTAKKAGSAIVSNIATGIKSAAGTVKSAISSVTKSVRSYLPFSPAEVGPLSKPIKWEVLFEGLEKVDVSKYMNRGLSNISNQITPSKLASSANTNYNSYTGDTISIHIDSINNQADVDYLMKQIEARQKAKGMQRGLLT